MSTDDFESLSDGSMFGFDMNEEVYRPLLDSQDKSSGANILEAASLNYVLSAIEYAMQCQGKHGNLCGKCFNELCSYFIKLYLFFFLNRTIDRFYLDHIIGSHCI